ncbi:hypothetical protein BDZ97DRAFT_1904521 [Flammula alnicola]|nr:hypothetical protein BDZ97DRAFT_1904521 [Flammula alnicola]
MPVATTSRRRLASRRQNSEDIEDARNTQANGIDDDVSDDDRAVAKVKKEKKGKRRADAEDDVGEDDDDDDDRIDVANFADQPLRKGDLHKLKGISDDWESMANQIGQQSSIYKDVAAAMAEAGETDTNSSKDLQALDRDMKDFLDVCAEMTLHAQSLDAMHQLIARGEPVANPQELYEDNLKQRMEEYAGKTSRQKYARDQRYNEFQSGIWEVHHPNEPMPPLTEFIPEVYGDDSDDDDEVEMGGATQNYNCPITLTPLVNPVTSRICKHSFSKDSILGYCQITSKVYKCPATGCNKSFKLSDCVADPELAKKVKAHQRRVALAAEDSDAEVID